RHTRSYGDWSSDVCSSDLDSTGLLAWPRFRIRGPARPTGAWQIDREAKSPVESRILKEIVSFGAAWLQPFVKPLQTLRKKRRLRSEERRVGKERRASGGGA